MPLAAMPTRPELIRLLKDARRGDVLLVESINRLSRVDDQACRSLKKAIDNRGIRIVSVDPPTSHQGMTALEFDPNQNGIVIHCLWPEAAQYTTRYEPRDRGRNLVHKMSLSALAVQRPSNPAKSIIRLCFKAVFGTLL
ncbi:putative resolvase [Pseudomonas syringae pv. actinidiae ICMP 19073]|nr:putative resolvase [Pseudomonas syringae pv. actinidiae ICMP 19073]